MRWRHWLATGFLAACTAALAAAQEPKAGDYYEDNTDLGFRVRMPARWESVPPAPDDGNLIIKFDPKTAKTIQLGPNTTLGLHAWIVKLDRRASATAAEKADGRYVQRHKTLAAWLEANVSKGLAAGSSKPKELEVDKVKAVEQVLSNGASKLEVRVYTMTFKIHPEVDVAVVFNGPGDPKKWSKYENVFEEMARSFRRVEVAAAKPALAEGASMRDKKRAELVDYVTRTPGWKLHETPSYFIISANDDRTFLDELKGRLEAIRAVYEQDYPAAKVEEIRKLAAQVKTGEGASQKAEDAVAKVEASTAESMEMSRCSIVRVCRSRDDYMSYGAPAGSGGYFDFNSRELVIYDDKANRGRNFTWLVLNHEAFHQYIFYFYGNIAPHSWYNEGTGDYYSGYVYKNGRFTLEKNLERRDEIKEAIQNSRQARLADLMRWDQKTYYGNGDHSVGLQNYAQGWSLVYFLRTGKKNNAKHWDPKWDTLLEDYLRVLAATGKPEQAIEQCLTGVDVEALEAAWLEYTK